MRETKSNGLGTDSIIFVDDVTGNPVDPVTGLMMPNKDVKKEQEDTASPVEPDGDSVSGIYDSENKQSDDTDSATGTEDAIAETSGDENGAEDATSGSDEDSDRDEENAPDEADEEETVGADTEEPASDSNDGGITDDSDDSDDDTGNATDADDAAKDDTDENDGDGTSDNSDDGAVNQDDVIPQSYYEYAGFWYDGIPLKAIAMSCASVPVSVLLYAFAPMRIMALLNGNGGIVWQCASFLVLIMLAASVLLMLASFVLGIRNVATKRTYRLGHVKNMLVALFFTMLMLFIGMYVTSTFVTGILGGAFDIGDLIGTINSVISVLPDTQAILAIAVNGSFIGMCVTGIIALISIVANIVMGEE